MDRKTLRAKFRDFGAGYRLLALHKLREYLRNNLYQGIPTAGMENNEIENNWCNLLIIIY